MRPRVHLCIAEADAGLAAGLVGRLVDPVSGLLATEWFGRGAFHGGNAEAMRATLAQIIDEASVVACLVGPAAHADRWVRWELETAVERGLGIVAIRLRAGVHDFMPGAVLHAGSPVVDAHVPSVTAALVRTAFTRRPEPENK